MFDREVKNNLPPLPEGCSNQEADPSKGKINRIRDAVKSFFILTSCKVILDLCQTP